MATKTSKSSKTKTAANPLYVKVGKRMRQARLMAKETNSRNLSLRLGWSAGRLNNFETGLSTPGIEETLEFCKEVKANPVWITYGVNSPRPVNQNTARNQNLMAAIDEAERNAELPALLDAIKLSVDRLEKLRASGRGLKVSDVMARRCEKHLGKPRGWLDESRQGNDLPLITPDMKALLEIYSELPEEDRQKFLEMGRVMLGK